MTTISVIDITIRCIDYVDGAPQIPYKEIRKAVSLESLSKTLRSSELPESVLKMVLEVLYQVESL